MKIGIFDSGIGGLSVLHHAEKMLPEARFVYYADVKHVPYGEKRVDQIKEYVREALQFLTDQGVDAILIACNTATSVASQRLRSCFPVPVVGMEPAVKKAVELYRADGKRILVAATPVTIAGDKLHNLLDRVDVEHDVDLLPLPGLVRFAEQGDFSSEEVDAYLKRELGKFDLKNYTALVLGCTHFNYFKLKFQQIFPNPVHFVDGNEGAVRQLMRFLDGKSCGQDEAGTEFYFSGQPAGEKEKKKLKACLEQLERVYQII